MKNSDHFLEMMNAYVEYLQRANQVDIDLVADMVAARWRRRRIWRYETAMRYEVHLSRFVCADIDKPLEMLGRQGLDGGRADEG